MQGKPERSTHHILIADDDPDARFVLGELLLQSGYEVTAVENGKKAIEAAQAFEFDLALIDVQMPGISGMQVAEVFKGDETLRYTPLFLITALSELSDIQKGLGSGADDYITKPYDKDELLARVGAGLRIRALYEALRASRNVSYTLQQRSEGTLSKLSDPVFANGMIGTSASMSAVRDLIAKSANADVPVLITGESGTGKELVAAALHYSSQRGGAPFVAQNCAALSESLLESELFGHVKGAFTGALKDRAGLFELADGGTLFLDEIGEMQPTLQAKLLRVLQDGVISPVGGGKPKKVRVRVVCATNRDLEREIAAGNFRSDLFYRINVVKIHLKPLRERLSDLPSLVEFFLDGIALRTGQQRKTLETAAVGRLCGYSWPGNVRELQNEIERLVIMSGAEQVIPTDLLDERILRGGVEPGRVESSAATSEDLPSAVAQLERLMISEALNRLAGNKSEAARRLGISRSSLIQKASQYGLG